MTPALYRCAKSDNCPHDAKASCRYALPHEHGTHVGPVRLWCAVPAGKSEKIQCVAIKEGKHADL